MKTLFEVYPHWKLELALLVHLILIVVPFIKLSTSFLTNTLNEQMQKKTHS